MAAVSEETASINGCQLHYQTLGQAHLAGWSHPAVLAMVGHSATLSWWGELVPAALAARGFFVILFDHRGTGETRIPNDAAERQRASEWLAQRGSEGAEEETPESLGAPFTFETMADDAVGLLDYLGIERAHIIGRSMSGRIAQVIGVRHPTRCLSLTLVMTYPRPTLAPEDQAEFARRAAEQAAAGGLSTVMEPEDSVEDLITKAQNGARLTAGDTPPDATDLEQIAIRVRKDHARGGLDWGGQGSALQSLATAGWEASVTPAEWAARLADLTLPTLILHGSQDPLVPVAKGRELHAMIR